MRSIPLPKLLLGIFLTAMLSISIVAIIYFCNFHGSLSNTQAEWGTFGDFMGGVLNPVLSFLGLIALLATLFFQSEELEISRRDAIESRKELSRSAEAQEELGRHQAKQVKVQQLTARIAVIKLLLSYDGGTLNEHFSSGGFASSTIQIKDYTGVSKRKLLEELAEIYSALKSIESEIA
jgi:uncharacterized membrane protein